MKFKRRCKNCGERAYIKVFSIKGKTICKCPKCLSEGEFKPNSKLKKKFK